MNLALKFGMHHRVAIGLAVAAIALWAGMAAPALAAPEKISKPLSRSPFPDIKSISMAGSYLAARHASVERDAQAAGRYYRDALIVDPTNSELLDRAFISSLAGGEVDEAVKLAERILKTDKTNRVARLVVGVHALKTKRYELARQNIAQSVRGPITDLVAAMLTGWAYEGAGRAQQGLTSIDKLTGPEWYPIFKDLHTGLIADVANRKSDAGARFERVYKLDKNALRVVDAYGRWLSRNAGPAKALEIYETFDQALPNHPLIRAAIDDLKAGKTLPPLVTTPQQGAAEALYGIGASLSRRGGEDLALVYLQLAIYLEPEHALALLSLADLYEAIKRPQFALPIYERVPASSPLKRNAQIQLASDLDTLQRTDESVAILKELVAANPKDQEALTTLGNIQRSRKMFADCGATYAQAIGNLTNVGKKDWVLFYFRGICFERDKQWAKAEVDLKKALEMQPDQPHVLNYLGYSWVNQGINLDDGMKMIRRAVEQRPDDGYIVDSLAWAYYRIGNYEEAMKHMERAIELKPEDPTINDHLGDVYWRVGRTLEARFQWAHARDLKPDPDDLEKIEAKIKDGLPPPEPNATTAEKDKSDKKGNGG